MVAGCEDSDISAILVRRLSARGDAPRISRRVDSGVAAGHAGGGARAAKRRGWACLCLDGVGGSGDQPTSIWKGAGVGCWRWRRAAGAGWPYSGCCVTVRARERIVKHVDRWARRQSLSGRASHCEMRRRRGTPMATSWRGMACGVGGEAHQRPCERTVRGCDLETGGLEPQWPRKHSPWAAGAR